MNDYSDYDFDKLLKDPRFAIDPIVMLNNQHKRGIEMLDSKGTLVFYINTNRSSEYMNLINRLVQQRNDWRKGVLSSMSQIDWLPKRLESRFASNPTPHLDTRYESPSEILKQFFETLQLDIDVLAEAIDYGKSAQSSKEEINKNPRVAYSKDGLSIDGINIPLGSKEQTVCGIIFRNKKLLNKNWLFDELLEEKNEVLRDNDLDTVRKLQSVKTRLNKKIAERTPSNIKDVFIGHGSIQLNPKYC